MGSKDTNSPKFRGSVGGYNRTDVLDYVARKEAEEEIRERRYNDLEKQCEDFKKQCESLKGEVAELNETLDNERTEKQPLIDERDNLKSEVEELKAKLKEVEEEKAGLKQDIEELRLNAKALADADPRTIQTAILSAQRMSESLIEEAKQKAEEICREAEASVLEKEEEGRQAVEAAEQEALRVAEEAEKKCTSLKQDYDRILLDVTKFKSELMDMYRRHMELLAALPEKTVEPECIEACVDIEFYENDED